MSFRMQQTEIKSAVLKDIPATLFIPLWARAKHTERINRVMEDYYAGNFLNKLDFDESVFSKVNRKILQMTITGVAARTIIFDEAVKEFMIKHPYGLIINIGCGLDSRFMRLDNGKVTWYDVDVKETITLKKQFFSENSRYKLMAGSILEPAWIKQVTPADRNVLIISEGTLMYFKEEEIKNLFIAIAAEFNDADFYFEAVGKWMKNKLHPTVKALGYNSRFYWTVKNYTDIEF